MTVLSTQAHAKLNLTLDVLGKRPDGYHDLEMVMQEISLGDDITLLLETGEPWRVISDSGEIPCNEQNLAIKAAKLFFTKTEIDPRGLTVKIVKQTPVCAGMGGGSADGAAVLRLLQEHYGNSLTQQVLYEIAEAVGSDVPFGLFGGTALAQEKGQILTRLAPMPDCDIVLCKPTFPISTPELFRAIDTEQIEKRPNGVGMLRALEKGNIYEVAACLCNVFEPIVTGIHPELYEIRRIMLECGAINGSMTGSGPTMFGIFTHSAEAESCYELLKKTYPNTYLTKPVYK